MTADEWLTAGRAIMARLWTSTIAACFAPHGGHESVLYHKSSSPAKCSWHTAAMDNQQN
jgi:hypothetical protein